jgi:hypothetical protein
LCPDQHFLDWGVTTAAGGATRERGGLPLSAFCFAGVATLVFGAAAAIAATGSRQRGAVRPFLPATILFALLAPGVFLQAYGRPPSVLIAWLIGTAAGALAGVTLGISARWRVARS